MADNRYYYFKDAKGNRHTVDKTAYDKDPMGFAKAFPGARMEVIDRKTGRRGDVSVKDASRVGDFGAHLFTGRTITRGKGNPNSSALGRAQQSVAQEKWGGGVVTHENTTASENVSAPKRNAVTLDDWNGGTTGKESELVKGLRAADMIRKRDEEQMPIDYTKPGAVKQMVGGARRAQKSLERRMEQAGQEAGRNAEGEIRRRNAPAFDLGNEDVNNNIVKTRGQLEKEMEESAATIADKNFADTFANMIAGERQAAEKRGFDAYLQRTVFSATPMGSTLLGTIAYNAERDPVKLQQNLLNTLGKNMESMLSDPNVAQKVVTESKRLGVDPEDYVKTALMPSIQNKLMSEYDKTELKEWMPRNTFVDIIDGLGDGFQVGSILDAALTKAQRQYRQRAIIATQNGENPYYQRDKYGVTEGVRSALSLASDVIGPGGGVLGGIGKGVGAASAKVFGNEVKTIARMANMSKLQRMFKPSILMRGAAETGANFGIYEGLKGAQSYSSTTDDVKLGEMLENSAVSAAHGAVSGATLGVVGKMLGGLGYNVGIKGPMGVDPNFGKNMLKGLGMKGVQIIGEGTAFYAGGNFNNALSGADTDWSAGNLLSNIMAAGIYKIVSTHTATGAANMLTPEKGQSYGGSVAVKFGTALYKAAMAPSAQGKAFAFTPDEKQQLFASGDKAGLPGKEGSFGRQDILTWAERVMKATPVGKEDKSGNVKVAREYYESVMQDPNVSWDAKMKLNALLGIAPATRPEMDMRTYTIEDGKRYVNEYAKDGTLLSKRSYKNMEQREAIEYDLMMQKENQRMLNGLGYILNRDCSRMDLQMEFLRQHDYDFDNPDSPRNQAIMDDMLGNNKTLTLKRGRTLHDEWLDFVSENGITTKLIKDIADAHGLSVEEMFKIVNKEPIKRTEEEQRACVELRKALNNIVYEDGMPHADQADSDGKDVVEENNLGTENPNNEAVAEVLNNMKNAEKAFNAALESNDVLKQEYERLTKEGLSEPQIYMELINSGLTQEQLAPFADYINAKAKAVGMYRGTEQKIAETVQKHVEQWSYKGELNGEKQEGGQMLFVKDNNGRLLIVGAGDVAFDSEGRARENVGDMLSVLDPNTKEMDFVSKKDVQLDHVEKTEDYAKNYQEMLEVMNSVAYAESEKGKEKSEKTDTKTESVVTPKEGASVPGVEDVKPIGEGEKNNPSDNGNGSNETLTFADGSPVPMTKDTKGRETADYSQMTPEQGAEWMSSQFGENAETAVDGQIKRAEKMLKEAEKIKVDYTGDLNDAKEAEAQKTKAVDAAKAELELYTNIKKVMTEKKVKAGMEKVGSVGEEGSVSEAGNLGAVREKFESGKRIVGNKRTRTLADGSKLRGHYEIVEADSLTPSHNANDGYKKSEGFPVNEEGRTINDRDYENDKQAQLVTDMIAMKYDGQAVDQVPVVTSDGIVVDGNGRTMAGQKAAKNGTDSAYLEALKENAENYGFTAEQIEQSGIKHPRLVLVSDEPMKYDTATFAKFNKNEKKSQGNTQQAVANSKKLSADEIGTIISEIEGSGSLDAFFNNPTAINSLLKRLIDKGVIGLNEVAGLREGEDKLSAAGKDFVKNLLLGSVFSENTIRMMGADAMLKTKALNGIRAVTDNMKLGDYALMKEIDQAVQLLYEARQGGSGVDAYLRTPAMFGENAADRFDPISQAIALALEGKAEDFRELMMAYNRNAAPYADANQTEMFGERPTKEDFVNEFLKLRNWKDYETRHSSKEGNGDAGSSEGTEPQAPGGNVITSEADYNKAVEQLKEAKGEERERILDQMGEYVKEFAKSNGYDEPVVLRTKQDLADAAKTENDKTIIENMPEGAHYPGYYEDGKIHIYLEGSTGSEELRETFEHESVHADNEVDPSRVEALVYSITDMNTLTREELERVVEVLSNMKEYTERASEMDDTDALYMLADEALAHLVTYAQEHGKDAMSEITDNPTLLNIAEISLKERENDRRRKEGLAKSGDKTLERKNIDDVSTEENGGPLEGDKEGKPENDNGGSPDRDVQARKGQREVDKAVKRESGKGKEKSEESDSKVEGVVTPKGDIKDATAPKGEKTKEEPSKTNPLAWLAHTAEMYKDEQVQKAKEELTKAKESGDASDIKRATADMKQAMETKLRGNGIGLVERRRIIGRELGKILGEEAGKTEAEKIDKPWKDMDGEERMATAEKNPLTEEEIRNNTSEENKSLIDDAVDYVNGNHGIVQQIAYLKIYDDVRNRHEDAPDNSGAEDRTQLAATDNGGSKELGVGTGREGGGSSEQLGDGTSGEGRPEQLQHGSQNSTGQPDVPTGEGSHSQGEGEAPGLGGVPTGNTQRERGSNDGSNGATVRHERGRGSSDKTATTNGGRKPTAKQGTHFPDNGTLEQKKQNTAAKKAALKDALKNWAKLGRGELGMNLAGLNSRQIEYLPEVMKAVKDYGVALIDEGIYRVKDWIKSIREAIGEDMKGMKFSDKDIDGFIEEMWNSKYTMNGETHTIGEWADIYGQEKLRKELAGPLTDKAKRQIEVEDVPVKIGDKANIEETLPFLLPQQQEDVLKAETQFFGNEHADREHAYGKGYMFTNGTGTGKTYTGLGIAKRLVKQGKGRILIVTPSQKKVSDWIKDGHNLNMEIRDLDSWAKDRGTTATTESGEGVVITTFANFGVNKKLLETKWDAVIYDESHRIMENKKGTETARSMQHYMVTNRDENHCFLRLQEINKDYQKQKSLGEQFDIERAKETERIRKEYKASHPSATERDVAYATSRMVPRDVYNFTPSDYVTFPVLGKIHAEYVKALSHYTNEVKPKLEAQAKNEWKDTKTIFLSATPFNTRENLDYVEGYIFKYPKVEKGGRMSGRTQFYLDHFGAGYKFRFNRLEQSTSNPEAVAKQEIAFSDYLQHTLGTMSGRIIDSPYDYSRDFPTVSPDHAERFNQAVQEALTSNSVLAEAYRKTIGDYNYGSALFETMKVANIIERIKAHLDAGRKVVIFHRRVESKEPLKPPFALMLDRANFSISLMNPGEEKNEAIQAVRAFRKKYADLLKWEQTLDYSMPREQIAKVFGKDNVLFFSGKESSKVKDKAVDTFNDDDSGKNIIVIQEASGKEGISLHDKTGKHQRVCITLALPQSPITALQIEGRTYRIGNKSNAIFEYPILGLNSEMMLFGQKFNNQVSTTENLALGSQARSLRDSFANGILEHSGVVPIDQQGVGGKEFDAPKDQSTDGFDNAVLDYYSNQKLNSRNREGVDYFPTPEPLGYKMMEWANMGEGDTVMEPSAGHGAIARYAPKGNQMVAIEPSQSLFAKLQLKAGGLGRKFVNTIFENYDISNKHDVVVMNPPFGTAGATAIAHLGKAFKHLEEGGRVVAIIPRGSTDKKFEKWINGEKTAVMRAEVELPDIVFKQAGTKVVCRVVVVDKISNEAMRAKAGSVEKVNLGGHYDKIEDFFEDLRDIEMPDRIIDTNTIMQKKSKQTAKDLKELKDVTVNLNEHGINVHVRGDRNDYSIMFDLGEYNAEQRKSILSGTYERFEEYERYTRDETSQAVIAELKKLTCKLAGMTEEEMQRYLKKQNDGKGVMYRMEHAAEVYGKANAHYRMELGDTFSDSKEHFDAVRDRAVEEKGIVMPNLNKEKVKVVEVEKHNFGSKERETINNAKAWAISNLVTTGNQDLPTMRDGTSYTISKKAIEKYLSESAVKKSENLDTHLSVLTKLTDVIHESIEAEIHADYNVKDETGKRKAELGYGNNILVHRLYGAVEMDGKIYRVKTTMQEFRGGEENKPHSYEVTKIELLDSPGKRENPDRPPSDASNNSIDTAKLLQGVEKSYDSGKKLLDESKNLTDGETFFRKEGDGVVTPEKTSGTSNAMSERIIKTVEKVAKRTGGKVKMVNSLEEIENPKVRKDIEKGKQVTGWYDEKTGEVHLYMPNIHNTYTAEKTVWHETVGHKGMRGLLGDKFDSYMRDLWMDLDNPINAELRVYVKEKMNMNHLGFYDAIEEFIAKSAEDGKGEPGFWNYIKNKVTDALHEIGYRVSPNVKDVKYMLWLAKNVQKHGDSPLWKMRAEAVRWKIEHEKTEYTKIEGGELYDNDGKSHDFEGMSREEWLEATDGEIHYRTTPSAATALDRYHYALDRHSYMATEAFMDNMLSLKKLMEAIDPSIKKIEDVASSMNPYLMQNITEGKMSDKSKLFEIHYMDPLSKAMSSVLDSFDGKKVEDRIRNFNLYMIRKHGLERNRVLFVRDKIREERKVKSEESDSIDALETAWKDERSDLRKKLDSGQIDLKEYYRQMDEWIVQNLDKDFKAEEHDYSGMHGLQGIDDMKSPYDDAGAIDEVMSQEASMESMKKGSVADFWKKVKAATDYSVNSDYENNIITKETHDGVLNMFDWYVPLRKFDEATAEDVYGYVTEMGDPSNYIGTTLMNAKGRKSLSNVEILAQIGLMGNRAIRNGGQNSIKLAFARFVRNSGEQNLVKETKVWVEKTGTDLNGNDIWEEAYPKIPEGASADDVATIVDAFETDMRAKQAKGEAKSLSNGTDIGFKFQRAKDKSQHFVDVKIAGRTHRFVVLGNPRAAQALNGMLENGKARSKTLQTMCRWMAMASTSWSPEFVNRNSLKDFELSSAHVLAKEGGRYAAKWVRYYGELNPLNMFHNEGAGALKSMKWKDLKNGVGFGLYARYREGTLGSSKMERYFKEFMENGGETGFVQLFSMHDMEKSYKSIVENETAKNAKGLSVKKIKVNFVEVLKQVGKDIEALNEVAENMARFATYCTSRDFGRSAARSAYDAKEVSSNFNRHGSGYGVLSFKNGEMSGLKKAEQKLYGGLSGWLRNYSMFFNAGVQSTSLLFKNLKHAPVSTGLAMMTSPFVLGLLFTLINNYRIQNEDEKDRGNVKDPYGELPEYIRRNNLCFYAGNGRFVTVPLAIELRAFYGLGDLAAGQTFAKNVKSQRNMAMDAVGCMSQLFPVVDFLNNPNFEKSVPNGAGMIGEAVAPTALVPIIEWYLNNDWKGAPIRRTGDKADLNPAWQNAYSNVPARLIDLNKWVNAKTNDVAPGNPEMKGNEALDMLTNPSGLSHFYDSYSSGFGTFIQRTAGLGAKVMTGKTDEIEVGDVPFLRSLFYTPREQSSMARTKAKWYNYKEEMEQTIANNDKLKSKNVPTMKRIENAAALENFEGSPEQRKVTIIKNAEKRMRHWNTMRKKWADDKKQMDFANKNIEMIMQEAVEDLDRIE